MVVLVVDLRVVNARYGGSFLDSSGDFCKMQPIVRIKIVKLSIGNYL